MCGRYVFAEFDNTDISKYYDIPQFSKGPHRLGPSYNIAPGTQQLTVTRNSPNQATYMMWGFKPSWFDRPDGVINARSETVDVKPMFESAFKNNRCLIPASGFYEWATINKEKYPFYIYLPGRPYFAFAGIYDHHYDKEGKDYYSFAILTTTPNKLMEPIHNRMPVILHKKDHFAWLDKDSTMEDLKSLCTPYEDSAMKAYIVSRRVNSPANDDKALLNEEK